MKTVITPQDEQNAKYFMLKVLCDRKIAFIENNELYVLLK